MIRRLCQLKLLFIINPCNSQIRKFEVSYDVLIMSLQPSKIVRVDITKSVRLGRVYIHIRIAVRSDHG